MFFRTLKDLFVNGGTAYGMFRQIASLKKSTVTSHCKGLADLWLSLLNDSSLTIRIPPEILRTYIIKIHITDPSVWSYHYFESLFLHKELKKKISPKTGLNRYHPVWMHMPLLFINNTLYSKLRTYRHTYFLSP